MNDEEKVYYPEIMQSNPFPEQEVEAVGSNALTTVTGSGDNKVTSSKTNKAKSYPKRLIAHETIGQALNTRSRKILGDFELIEQGAMRVGKYTPGVSGEIALTPEGIRALNAAGVTTFAIDVETGSPVFAGEIFGGSININNQFEVDENGNVIARSIALIDSNTQFEDGNVQDFTVLNQYDDVSGSTISLNLDAPHVFLLLADIRGGIFRTSGSSDYSGRFDMEIWNATSVLTTAASFSGEEVGGDLAGDTTSVHTASAHGVVTIPAGESIIKLRGRLTAKLNNGAFKMQAYKLTALDLGRVLPS